MKKLFFIGLAILITSFVYSSPCTHRIVDSDFCCVVVGDPGGDAYSCTNGDCWTCVGSGCAESDVDGDCFGQI